MIEEFITNSVLQMPHIGLLVILMVAGLGVPLPEDIPLLTAGWLVHRGLAGFWGMAGVGLVGVLAGDLILFSMARRYGEHIVEHRWLRRIASPALLRRAENIYARHGLKIIFVARFMPGLRAVLFMVAGIFQVRPLTFLAIDGTAALGSVPLLIWLGWRFGQRIEQLAGDVRRAQLFAGACLAVAIAAWIVWEYYQVRRRRRLMAENAEAAAKAEATAERMPREGVKERAGAAAALIAGRTKGAEA